MIDYKLRIFNEDCINPEHKIESESIDLGIFDPPFGIHEASFNKYYKRKKSCVIPGYIEAPADYEKWTYKWMKEATRVLKLTGSMYVFIGNSNLRHILNAAHDLNLYEINHLIWKYNFGVNTKNRYVTSHYHILYYGKTKHVVFNTYCRYGSQEKNKDGRSLLYKDLEDVFVINREYAPNEPKNQNKLPEKLINKLILYSSNENDTVCDFFMGNFTTAYCSIKLGRRVVGYELNSTSYNYHIKKIKSIEYGKDLKTLKKVTNITPKKQHAKITNEERFGILEDYKKFLLAGKSKKEARRLLQEKYERGQFSIYNIVENK